MQHTGVQATKYVYMALINAYAKFGKFEKAKQLKVIREAGIPYRYLNEVKSVLVSALSSNGKLSEALLEYDEIKKAGDKIEPKAAISLIENLRSEGNLDRLQQLLEELIDSSYWFDGCSRVVLYYVRHNLARFPVVEPDFGHTKLHLAREGLDAIRRIKSPVAAFAVIGPYRSGKSFLLNQLLSLPCDKGFGVGHMRDTKTKGIWVWGDLVEVVIDGVKVSVLFLDTEGFESIGKSNVYDDRIFALATIMSSVLIYNLPETIREADISRLSFAVEIAEEFYGRVKGQDVAFEPAKLLWLIQRDFLQGKSVQQMVNEALQRVPNANGDRYIDQVNQIRESLAIMGDNSTAFSLPQPHLQRTKLCDMKDSELDQSYVEKREHLKQLVASIIRPKIVQGKTLNGGVCIFPGADSRGIKQRRNSIHWFPC